MDRGGGGKRDRTTRQSVVEAIQKTAGSVAGIESTEEIISILQQMPT